MTEENEKSKNKAKTETNAEKPQDKVKLNDEELDKVNGGVCTLRWEYWK